MSYIYKNKKYENNFDEIEYINEGSYGVVFKAKDKKENNVFAVKKTLSRKNDESENLKVLNEVKFLYLLKSQFVVKCFNHWFEENYYDLPEIEILNKFNFRKAFIKKLKENGSKLLLHIQLYYCETTLHYLSEKIQLNHMIKSVNVLTTQGYFIATELFFQIVNGLNFIHSMNVIHRDLKLSNVLISLSSDPHFVKLADFGLTTFPTDEILIVGTERFRAPEVEVGLYFKESDLFSLGVIAEVLFSIDVNNTTFLEKRTVPLLELILTLNEICPEDRGSCSVILEKRNTYCVFNSSAYNLKYCIEELII